VSYYTLQLYLNGDKETLKGGATRFWPNPRLRKGSKGDGVYVGVEPRMGRVLVFAQGDLIHSGEEVTAGVKYNICTDILYNEEEPAEPMSCKDLSSKKTVVTQVLFSTVTLGR
jgi:hypothetical protein